MYPQILNIVFLKNHQFRGNRGRVKNLVWCGEIKVAHINDTVVKPGLASRSKHIFVNVASLECKIPSVYEYFFIYSHALQKSSLVTTRI